MLSNLYRYFLNSAARLSQHCVLCGVGGQGWLCPPCRADLPRLAADAMLQTRLLVNNPREVLEADALAIYQQAY